MKVKDRIAKRGPGSMEVGTYVDRVEFAHFVPFVLRN